MKLIVTAHNCYSILVLITLMLITLGPPTYSTPQHGVVGILHKSSSMIKGDSSKAHQKGNSGEELGKELYPMGSSLPDCTHACGVCSPCKRVMVSFRCASESCPVVYRCLCKGKYYHVPSSK
ncbi:uncharacterized protein LOC141608924 [Silene latifolia]|uniref:uncharacterized protein LOC141608924 n=1 Tax=Silene latifolia TaxID=37657 RepID=UPI003D774C01